MFCLYYIFFCFGHHRVRTTPLGSGPPVKPLSGILLPMIRCIYTRTCCSRNYCVCKGNSKTCHECREEVGNLHKLKSQAKTVASQQTWKTNLDIASQACGCHAAMHLHSQNLPVLWTAVWCDLSDTQAFMKPNVDT